MVRCNRLTHSMCVLPLQLVCATPCDAPTQGGCAGQAGGAQNLCCCPPSVTQPLNKSHCMILRPACRLHRPSSTSYNDNPLALPCPALPRRATTTTRMHTQLWLLMLYVLIARATPLLRLGIACVVAAFTVTCLPRRLWVSQFKRLGFICGLIFVFTALGADGVPPVLQQHSLPPSLEGVSAPLTPDTPYSYVVFNLFGWITITRRSINLAITASALTFCALQSASLCLVTTPGEEMALGLSRHVCTAGRHGLGLGLRFRAYI